MNCRLKIPILLVLLIPLGWGLYWTIQEVIFWEKPLIDALLTTPENTVLIAASVVAMIVINYYQFSEQDQPEVEPAELENPQEQEPSVTAFQHGQQPHQIDGLIVKTVTDCLASGKLQLKAQPVNKSGHIEILQQQYNLSIVKPDLTKIIQPPQKNPEGPPDKTPQATTPKEKTVEETMKNLTRGAQNEN